MCEEPTKLKLIKKYKKIPAGTEFEKFKYRAEKDVYEVLWSSMYDSYYFEIPLNLVEAV